MTKKKQQRRHSQMRALERYGLDLRQQDLAAIVKLIQDHKAEFIERQSRRVTLWWVEYNGQRCRVVYDSIRKEIASFLPQDSQ